MSEEMKSFIEVQFPVSKISKESYKERKGAQSQTITGLGKWWGRKPLILVRAALLGLLLPASDDPVMDREIFLKVLTMDTNGLLMRKNKFIDILKIYKLVPSDQRELLLINENGEIRWKDNVGYQEIQEAERTAFCNMSYDERLKYCVRPEQTGNLSREEWAIINKHLDTNAYNLTELIQELGNRSFGHIPIIGDAFCGGGSIPFEASRVGCEVYSSDLNPIAGLLTWASLNILNKTDEEISKLETFQLRVFNEVVRQVNDWEIEVNELGWRARYYLYCLETVCPECGYKVPLSSSWVTSERQQKTAVELIPDHKNKAFKFRMKLNLTSAEIREAAEKGTVRNSRLICPNCEVQTPISFLRENYSGTLREWEASDFSHRSDDIFQDRLYCICYEETYKDQNGRVRTRWHFVCPDDKDLQREKKVLNLLKENFKDWQDKGFIPSRKIEPGDKTDEPIRTRGWTHWHHMFNTRQLLINGLFIRTIKNYANDVDELTIGLLGANKSIDKMSKLSRWNPKVDKNEATFYNQAFNTLYNYCTRGTLTIYPTFCIDLKNHQVNIKGTVKLEDARTVKGICDIWITDPPYADAVNYHELSEFFLTWNETLLKQMFPDWYTDSKRALAITGRDEGFRKNMMQCYSNLAKNMPENGSQIVMFTHQDAGVWADLAMILWAAGLRVTSAWCIATETDSAFKQGNYVQGTVLLILRKQTSNLTVFMDEIYPEVENEVTSQLESMLALDDKEDPNFSDTDYQLAAYAAALRVLTKYHHIEEIDVEKELSRVHQPNEVSPIEEVIAQAVEIACNYLIPTGIEKSTWQAITPEERFYIKGLEMESHAEYRAGAYQEMARGFGLRDYRYLLANVRANQTRLKTASELATRNLGDEGFGNSILRHILFAVREVNRIEETEVGRNWLRNELGDRYWDHRQLIIALLDYLYRFQFNQNMESWNKDAHAAHLLMGAICNEDHI